LVLLGYSEEAATLYMRQPDNRAKGITSFFLLKLIIVMQVKLRLIIQPQHCPFTGPSRAIELKELLQFPCRDKTQLRSVDLGCQVNVLVEFYL
jgi:hypothetical protein